ncbi:MAG TPA: DUF3828 domain-containing protein [Pyrinomonadaceae bacterium]|nr:DUF3828 domain-containing protein [Pyrinomonadaceae bacterium]
MKYSKFKIQNWSLTFCIFNFAFLISSCGSVPNLETPECMESRQTVKKLYSNHFGNDLKPSAEKTKSLEMFLSKELAAKLNASNETAADYFTQTEDYPKAFRIGGCETVSTDKTNFEILLFWRDDKRMEEQKIKVEAVKENGNWLVNKVWK